MQAMHRHSATSQLTRGALLSQGAKAAATVAAGGLAFNGLAVSARADALPDNDLAYLRLVIASELLAIDFYATALATKKYKANAAATLRRALADEKAHYTALAKALTAAGPPPATAADIDFAYPRGSFASRASIARLGTRLEGIFVGVALGAAAGVQTEALRLQVAQIAASESRHLATFAVLTGHSPVGPAFPAALSLDRATTALAAFES
jgi:demethoxyubiquinone hydroxylase (CLK1/Coq7/Cat5 family)